ncbi:hypothetical protein ACVILI_000487 [Mesorhizobium sp. USDA 4775]
MYPNLYYGHLIVRQLPEPHPLDFDWRYTPGTIATLSKILPVEGSVLAVGTPNLARHLSTIGRDVMLIDRQPIQLVSQHLAIDIDENTPIVSGYTAAIVDPPWYVEHVLCWLAWTANCVGVDGEILATIWPAGTRPNDEIEYQFVLEWLRQWATAQPSSFSPIYETPIFERQADVEPTGRELSHTPRRGRLLSIKVKKLPKIPSLEDRPQQWLRFTLNNYQLALRMHPYNGDHSVQTYNGGPVQIVPHSRSVGWTWPSVSKRASGRGEIDLWSSRNEVALVKDPAALAGFLRRLASLDNSVSFDTQLSQLPQLADWAIPKPPYWRFLEWSHRQ